MEIIHLTHEFMGEAEIEMIVCQHRREGREDLPRSSFFKQGKLQQKDTR
jgi:hypothetical protein